MKKWIMGTRRFQSFNLADTFRYVGAWWLKEALNLVPDKVAKLLGPRGRRLLAVGVDGDDVRLQLLTNKLVKETVEVVKSDEYSAISIDRFLDKKDLERADVEIGISLPSENIFSRRIVIPREAKAAVKEIVAQDLSKKTPFKPEEIYSDFIATGAPGQPDKTVVLQWVVKRQYVQEALAIAQIDIENLCFVIGTDSVDKCDHAPFIDLRAASPASQSLLTRAVSFLSCLAVVLTIVVGGLVYWRQQTTLDELDRQIGLVKVKAHEVRAAADRLQERQNMLGRLRMRWSESPGFVDLWEEITRVLPSHTWLTELKLADSPNGQEQQVSIVGFSSAATGLVGTLDSSALFSGAALTAPVALDPIEGRERFALQTRVKKPDFGGASAR
jgi:general secretion pathway protein L